MVREKRRLVGIHVTDRNETNREYAKESRSKENNQTKEE